MTDSMRKIGIDFGTCNIKGAEKKKNGDVSYISLGKTIDKTRIPNVIIYEKKEGGCRSLIGEVALKKPVSEQDRIRNIKAHLQESNWTRELSFGKKVNVYDVTLDIMKRLYEEVHNVNKAVEVSATITVPVNFSKRQQLIVARAAEEAGFHVEAVITEPFAALFGLMQDNLDDGEAHNILIFDFGGGTLDLCLAGIKNTNQGIKIETQATAGISYGGNHINNAILEHILKDRAPEQLRAALEERNALRRAVNRYYIMEAIDTMKAELFEDDVEDSESTEVLATMVDGTLINLGEVSVNDIYEMFRKQGWDARISRLLNKLFDDSSWIPEDITDVFVIGGTSSIPFFRNVLEDYFGNHNHQDVDSLFELNDEMDTEKRLYLSVAAGAAIYNELLEDDTVIIKDKIPFMIYAKDENGKKCAKLTKNDCFKDYFSGLAPITEWMKENKQIGIYQTVFDEDDKEVFLGNICMNEEIISHATLYRLLVDQKRNIQMEFGYLLTEDCDCSEDNFCVDWRLDLKIEV